MTLRYRCYLRIKQSPITTSQLRLELGLGYNTVKSALQQLKRTGHIQVIERRGRGFLYSVTDKPCEPDARADWMKGSGEVTKERKKRREAKNLYGTGGNTLLEQLWTKP